MPLIYTPVDLGDFDSVSAEGAEIVNSLEKQSPERVLRLPQEKDDTDMLAALKAPLLQLQCIFLSYFSFSESNVHVYASCQSPDSRKCSAWAVALSIIFSS